MSFTKAFLGEGLQRAPPPPMDCMTLTRASVKRDPQVITAIRKLARDRMPEVRLQIVQNLQMLHALDQQWVWSEVEYVLAKERARGVVSGAIDALARIAQLVTSLALFAPRRV